MDTISDHFSFQSVKNLSVTWLNLSDFGPGLITRHFAPWVLLALTSLVLSLSRLFDADDLLIHTPYPRDDSPPSNISILAPALLSFDTATSPLISHLAGLNSRFSSISAFDYDFSCASPSFHTSRHFD